MGKVKNHRGTCALIPGFGEKAADEAYVAIRRSLERRGWRVLPIDITWSRTTMTGWLDQAERKLAQCGRVEAAFGFSFGAMVALLLAARGHFPSFVIAASPSPYFKELLPGLPPIAERMLGPRRMRDFKKYSIKSIRGVLSSRVEILAGSKDFRPLVSAAKRMHHLMPGSHMTVIPNVPHDLGDPCYFAAVEGVMGRI